MQGNFPLHGTLRKTEGAGSVLCIEWTLVDFKRMYEEMCGTFARSPTFQMKDATWSIKMRRAMNDLGFYGIFVYVLRHRSEVTTPHSIKCLIVLKREECILGGYVANRNVEEDTSFNGFIGESRKLLSGNDIVVSCTFYEEFEGRSTEEISKNVSEPEKQSKNSGIDILSSHMKNLFLNRENCDFVIKVKGREFRVHKAILSARYSVLGAMLLHDMAEKNSNATEIVDCEPVIFEKFLLYLYSGQVEELSWENATSLYTLGDKYDVEHLREECVEFMESNLCVDAFCDAITLGVRHNLPRLVKSAEDFFLKNAMEILLTPKWQLMMKEHPVTCNELFIKYVKGNKCTKCTQ